VALLLVVLLPPPHGTDRILHPHGPLHGGPVTRSVEGTRAHRP
jgi:hypothetical protein